MTADDGDEQTVEYPDTEYVHELPDAERDRRMAPWGYDSWDDVDLDAVTCKRYPGSTKGSLACHAHNGSTGNWSTCSVNL